VSQRFWLINISHLPFVSGLLVIKFCKTEDGNCTRLIRSPVRGKERKIHGSRCNSNRIAKPKSGGLILLYGIAAFSGHEPQANISPSWPSGTPFTFMAKQETLLPHQKYFLAQISNVA